MDTELARTFRNAVIACTRARSWSPRVASRRRRSDCTSRNRTWARESSVRRKRSAQFVRSEQGRDA